MKTLAEKTAELLHDRIRERKEPILPSLSVLASEFRVSRKTIITAAAILRDHGIIEFHRGRRMHVVGAQPQQTPPPCKSRVDAFYEELVESIRSGVYRSGQPLPKVNFFVLQRNCANRTVISAYQQLIREGFAYRKGKSFIVGAPPAAKFSDRKNGWPVLLLISPRNKIWRDIYTSARTNQFAAVLSREAESFKVQLLIVQESGADADIDTVTSDGLKDYVDNRAAVVLGAVLAGSAKEYVDFAAWIKALAHLKCPVSGSIGMMKAGRKTGLPTDISLSFCATIGYQCRNRLFALSWSPSRGIQV